MLQGVGLDCGVALNAMDNHVNELVNKGWFGMFQLVEGTCGLLFVFVVGAWLTWPNPQVHLAVSLTGSHSLAVSLLAVSLNSYRPH